MLETSSGYGGPEGYGQPPGGYGQPPGGYGQPPGQPPPGGGFAPPPAMGGYGGAGAPGGGAPGAWSATEAMGYAWNAIIKDFGGVGLPLIAGVFVMTLPAGITSGIRSAVVSLLMSSRHMDMMTLNLINIASTPIILVVNALAQAFMLGGLFSFALKVERGQKPEFGEIFQGGRFFMPMLIASLLQGFGMDLGFLLCFVPGVILACGWLLYPVLVVERGLGGVDALKESWRITTGQKMNVFILLLLFLVATIAGLLACCVGVLVVGPLCVLAITFVYLRLNGEEPRPAGIR